MKLTLLNIKLRRFALTVAFGLLLTGCSKEGGTPQKDSGSAAGSFVNKVWQVSSSSAVAAGTLYVFLSEGTLLITSPNSKPALGTWKYEGDALTMVEEGIPYKTDILRLTASEFQIRSNNPGQPVETTLVPAESRPVSK